MTKCFTVVLAGAGSLVRLYAKSLSDDYKKVLDGSFFDNPQSNSNAVKLPRTDRGPRTH